MLGRLCRIPLAVSLAVLMSVAPIMPAFAQQQGDSSTPAQSEPVGRTIQEKNPNYTFGKRWFPTILAPYTQTVLPEPILVNSPRLEQMVQNGSLSISLQDPIDLALQDNLSISVERYVPWLAEASILHTL